MSTAAVPAPFVLERSPEEIETLLVRVQAALAPEDYEILASIVRTYVQFSSILDDKSTTLKRLRAMLFGASTETRKNVLGAEAQPPPKEGEETAGRGRRRTPRPPRKGHGRNGADAYPGAERTPVPHPTLTHGAACTECSCRVYRQAPVVHIRIRGRSAFAADAFALDRYRCGTCGVVFTAELPEGVSEEKYDPTAGSMAALLRYGHGLPMNRIQQLQAAAGVPMPVSTQWDLLDRTAARIQPIYDYLLRVAAQGELYYNDDTPMVILSYLKEERERRLRGEAPSDRTGIFTTGIVAVVGEHRVVLYATGHQHAGENLFDVLQRRAANLRTPMQMCDALSRNSPGVFLTILAACLAHARRYFVDVVTSFPEAVGHVIDQLAFVYRNDEHARNEGMSPRERLQFHQAESGPVMDGLHAWFTTQLQEKKVEPNSGLGKAIHYAQKHWERLTLFLRQEGAPLDNNLCERMLKRAIMHRKNSLFYKTERGAQVGDLFMSLIATAHLAHVDPFDYLTELQRNAGEVARRPADWLPWAYKETLARMRDLATAG